MPERTAHMVVSPAKISSSTGEKRRDSRRHTRYALLAGVMLAAAAFSCLLSACDSLCTLKNTPASLGSLPEQPGPALTRAQALEDFRYLFQKIRDYHPYLELKKRTEGYDWIAHEAEFESLVKKAKSNEEFAKAISRVVLSLNNAHTGIISGSLLKTYDQLFYWKDIAAETTPEKADYWYALASKPEPGTGPVPFAACYVRGEYVVVDVAPDPNVSSKVLAGYRVSKINGIPVDEYVASGRGTRHLYYDPEFRKLYDAPRLRFFPPFTWSSAEFVDLGGKTVTVDMDFASDAWTMNYIMPPGYVRKPNTWDFLYDLVTCTLDWKGTRVGYVYVPTLKSDYASDTERLREFFASVKDLPAIIIDIRTNGGGSDQYWKANIVELLGTYTRATGGIGNVMRRRLAEDMGARPKTDKSSFANLAKANRNNVPPEIWTDDFREPETTWAFKSGGSVGYQGNLYVLTSRQVFSSSETFAATCKVTGFATLVGTYTGGDGFSRSPGILVLPNSGMVIRFPSTMGLNPDWTANEEYHTSPDVLVEPSVADLLNWFDRVDKGGFPTMPDPEVDAVLRKCLDLAVETPVRPWSR